MSQRNALVSVTVVLAVFGGLVQAETQRGSITPLPEGRDPNVYDGPADVRYSHEWSKAKYRVFRQAKDEGDTVTVVALAQEMAGGWLYNANAAYSILEDAISYVKGLEEECPTKDLISLIRARAEVVQYVNAGNQESRDSLWTEIVCADYEIAQVYSASGDHVSALRALERYYAEQREQRTRLRTAPYPVLANCPLDEEDTLSSLLEAYSVVASTTAPDPATAQGYLEAAIGHAELLEELAGPEKVNRWANQTGAEAYGNPVWSVDSLLLFIARKLNTVPARYLELVVARSKGNVVRDPFSYGDAIAGKEFLVSQDADEETIETLYDAYRTMFLAWPEAEKGFEYQGISLSQLSFAIERGLLEKAEEIIGQLAGLKFSDSEHSQRFTKLQFAYQRAQSATPPGLRTAS